MKTVRPQNVSLCFACFSFSPPAPARFTLSAHFSLSNDQHLFQHLKPLVRNSALLKTHISIQCMFRNSLLALGVCKIENVACDPDSAMFFFAPRSEDFNQKRVLLHL